MQTELDERHARSMTKFESHLERKEEIDEETREQLNDLVEFKLKPISEVRGLSKKEQAKRI